MKLVTSLKQRLDVSTKKGRWRVAWLMVILASIAGIIATVIIIIPNSNSREQRIDLLPGDHTQVPFEERVDEERFLELAEGNPTSISLGDGEIYYTVLVDGNLYGYRTSPDKPFGYKVESQRLVDSEVVRELDSNRLKEALKEGVLGGVFVAMLIALAVFLIYYDENRSDQIVGNHST